MPLHDIITLCYFKCMADKKPAPKIGRDASSGQFMGVKIARPAVLPAKVSEASIRAAVRSVVTERRPHKS